jgi:hypothetical protein
LRSGCRTGGGARLRGGRFFFAGDLRVVMRLVS